MGTIIQVSVESQQAERLLNEAERMLIDYEKRFSANNQSSDLMKINQAAGLTAVKVDSELFELIRIGKQQSTIEGSYLNIAIGPLIQEWRVGFKDAKYPDETRIKQLLTKINPHKIQIDEENQQVFLEEKGMAIDLGALAKGYFADKIISFFKTSGASAGFIDLGGNVLTFGEASNHEDGYWRIAIQNPFLPRGNFATVLKIKNQSVVTSGIYERQFTWQGKTYHHIFDSQTGYPIQSKLASITIVSTESLAGEIWTTKLFGADPTKIITKINQESAIEALVITTDGLLAKSDGIKTM